MYANALDWSVLPSGWCLSHDQYILLACCRHAQQALHVQQHLTSKPHWLCIEEKLCARRPCVALSYPVEQVVNILRAGVPHHLHSRWQSGWVPQAKTLGPVHTFCEQPHHCCANSQRDTVQGTLLKDKMRLKH